MSKKCLPQRSTRGQLPLFLRDPPPTQKKQKPIALQDPQEVQRRNLEYKRKNQQLLNLKKYPFHRAVHYFFDLNIFPRCEGHISYAIDQNNALQNTFSNDQNELKKCNYGSILNRKLFGLPVDEKFIQSHKKENKHKNLCHVYLWQTQDKKYQSDRMITTLQVLLKKLKKGISLQQLKSFSMLSKDEQLQSVLDQDLLIEERTQVVNSKIKALQQRKELNRNTWEADDQNHFYHSLNQKLHNQIGELKKQLSVENALKTVFNQSQENKTKDRKSYSKKTLHYYYHGHQALQILFLPTQSQPLDLFLFQDASETIKLAAQVVAKRSQFIGEVHFYEAKSMLKKLFNFELSFKTEKTQTLAQYQKNFRKKCEQIQRWKQKNSLNTKESSYPSLNQYLIEGKLVLGPRLQISGKEYFMMLIIYWLCKAFNELKPLLTQFPQLMTYISSDYFPKVYTSLVEATSSALVGMIHIAIEALADLFSKPDPLALVPVKLELEYSVNEGLGLLLQEIEGQGSSQISFGRQQAKIQPINKRFKCDYI